MKINDKLTSILLLCLELVFCQESTHNQTQTTVPGIVQPPSTAATAAQSSEAVTEGSVNRNEGTIDPILQRSRIARLQALREHVLASLGWTSPPDIDSATKDRLLRRLSTPVFVSRQRHCYLPACDLPMVDLPDYMNRSIWFDTSSRNIRYYFTIPTNTDPNLEIKSASIKLHLKRRQDCPCAYDRDISTSRLHIKMYQYRRPIRSHSRLRHSNMRLIDAKMVTWEGSRWVSFRVTDAVRRIITRGRRNGGFEVQVRDMEENSIDAKTVIDPTVCSFVTSYDCTESDVENDENEEVEETNYSPVLEITSETTTIIDLTQHGVGEY
ncbi:Bone morphogenetic protein 2 [Mactra antiquata]